MASKLKFPNSEILLDTVVYAVTTYPEWAEPKYNAYLSRQQERLALYDKMPDSLVAEVVLHEIVHGIMGGRGPAWVTDAQEEELTELLGRGLAQVFRDNPEWIKWLLKQSQNCCKTEPESKEK